LLDRLVARVDRERALAVERLAAREQRAQLVHRARPARHRPAIALREHALVVLLGARLEPDRAATRAQAREGLGARDDRATGGEHEPLPLGQDRLECFGLEPVEVRFALEREDLGER